MASNATKNLCYSNEHARSLLAWLAALVALINPTLVSPALAQAECGVSTSVTCAPGSYPNGINYENDTVGNIPDL